jgi:hypothetical protein
MTDELIPITDEQAKAIQEAAKLGKEGLGVLKSVGGYLREILGSVPEDLVGLLGGDWLRHRRAENLEEIARKARERLNARGVVDAEPVSLTLALPMLRAASDESRKPLQDLWARLLANARDPSRAGKVRQEFIETVRRLDPLDALVLQRMFAGQIDINQTMRLDDFAQHVGTSRDELVVSLRNLHRLDLVNTTELTSVILMTPTGRGAHGSTQRLI